jgi:hypothetical protein
MIIKLDNPNKEPCMFKAQISTNKKTLIGIAVYCAKKPYTFYTYNKTYVNGKRVVDIRLPICPKNGYIRIWNAEAKTAKGKESGFELEDIKRVKLSSNLNIAESKNENLKNFLKFAEEFSECASYLSTQTPEDDRSIYKSDDGKFEIHYVDEIIGNDGEPRRTSMRVNNRTGVMELAKKYVVRYTVPERIAILLHEFSHFYLNKVHSDEFEADMNALMIYCALGFPRKEGGTAFYKVFYRTPSNLNVERMKKIMALLKNFDRTDFKIIK